MKTDFCIPTYNACDKLKNCVESVLRHTDMNTVNLTIINDGSTDNTASYLEGLHKEHPEISVINLEKNYFKCRPLNMALKSATSEFIIFLDDDTEVTAGWLDGLKQHIVDNKKVGMVGAKILFPDNRIFAAEHRLPARLSIGGLEVDMGQRDYVRECDALVGTCYIMRTEMLHTVGEYDEELKWHEDIDYCTRARLKGYKLVYNGMVRIYHHHLNRESGSSARNLKYFDDKWAGTIDAFPLEDSHIADKLFAKAIKAFENKDWEISLSFLEQLEREDARFNEPFLKGKCLYELNRLEEAVVQLEDERAKIPTHVYARMTLIQAYKKLGYTDKMRKEADSTFATVPELFARVAVKMTG